jgi:curved DNA-binding protein
MPVASSDYYEALGVSRDASSDEVRRAYRNLARKLHPDVNKEPGAEDRFKEVSEAYDVLRDPEKRARYDRVGADWRPDAGPSGFGNGPDPGPGFRDGGFEDLFGEFFGGRRGRTGRGGFEGFSFRGGDQTAELEVTLEETVAGGRRRLALGDGRELEVEIPPGVREGQTIRVPGHGGQGAGDGGAGDLLLRVHYRPHPRFRVKGRDLYVDLPLAPWEAALGAEVSVPTLTGSARLKVPPGSSSGRRLRLRGQGMPGGTGTAGDLYAVVKIVVPKKLTRRERELFQQLASTSKFDPRRAR